MQGSGPSKATAQTLMRPVDDVFKKDVVAGMRSRTSTGALDLRKDSCGSAECDSSPGSQLDFDDLDCDYNNVDASSPISEKPIRSSQGGHSRISYHVMTPEEAVAICDEKIEEIEAVIPLPTEVRELLLQDFKWNQVALAEAWVEDQNAVLEKVKLDLSQLSNESSTGAPPGVDPEAMFFCPVIAEAVPYRCWQKYLATSIFEEGLATSLNLRCLMFDCNVPIKREFFKLFLDPHDYERFRILRQNAIITSCRSMTWCPAPNCDWVVLHGAVETLNERKDASVTCMCGHRFCFLCQIDAHTPVPCRLARLWVSKNSSEAHNLTWIFANTQSCPRCKNPIEKNQGCMHMTCRCKYEFCWLCRKDWDSHDKQGLFLCNVYETSIKHDPKQTKEESIRQQAKEALEKYAHYFERFRAHQQAERIARDKQMPAVQNHITVLHRRFPLAAEAEFLEAATLQLVECRRFLKWSYAFGYKAKWEGEKGQRLKTLFEYQQGDLERNVDLLQEETENFDPEKYSRNDYQEFIDFKSRLITLTNVVKDYFERMNEAFRTELIVSYEQDNFNRGACVQQ